MATDTELLDMAVDSEGLDAGLVMDKSHMQELEMLRIFANQVANPKEIPVEETQSREG